MKRREFIAGLGGAAVWPHRMWRTAAFVTFEVAIAIAAGYAAVGCGPQQ